MYASEAIYELLSRDTSRVVDLVVANQTFVSDPRGVGLRTVELAVVQVAQPACSIGVRLLPGVYSAL